MLLSVARKRLYKYCGVRFDSLSGLSDFFRVSASHLSRKSRWGHWLQQESHKTEYLMSKSTVLHAFLVLHVLYAFLVLHVCARAWIGTVLWRHLFSPGARFSNVPKLFGWHQSLCIVNKKRFQTSKLFSHFAFPYIWNVSKEKLFTASAS